MLFDCVCVLEVLWVCLDLFVLFDSFHASHCRTLEQVCSPEQFAFSTQDDCYDEMSKLPFIAENSFGQFVYRGNTTGCRMVHSFIALRDPEMQCPHLSFASEIDRNGQLNCDEATVDSIFHNFTKAEMEMIQRVAYDNDIFDPTGQRFTTIEERKPCNTDLTLRDFLLALEDANEFEDITAACFGYLQDQDATPDMTAYYWTAIFGLTFAFRIISSIFLRVNSLR